MMMRLGAGFRLEGICPAASAMAMAVFILWLNILKFAAITNAQIHLAYKQDRHAHLLYTRPAVAPSLTS